MKAFVIQAIARLKEFGLPRCLAALTALFAMLLLIQGLRYGCARGLGKDVLAAMEAGKNIEAKRERPKELKDYDEILKKGILGKIPGKSSPKLFGIFFDAALFGSSAKAAKPFKVGGTIPGGEKIIEIGVNKVVLEKDGKKRTLQVFGKGGAGPQGGGRPGPSPRPRGAPVKGGRPVPAAGPSPSRGPAGEPVMREGSRGGERIDGMIEQIMRDPNIPEDKKKDIIEKLRKRKERE